MFAFNEGECPLIISYFKSITLQSINIIWTPILTTIIWGIYVSRAFHQDPMRMQVKVSIKANCYCLHFGDFYIGKTKQRLNILKPAIADKKLIWEPLTQLRMGSFWHLCFECNRLTRPREKLYAGGYLQTVKLSKIICCVAYEIKLVQIKMRLSTTSITAIFPLFSDKTTMMKHRSTINKVFYYLW